MSGCISHRSPPECHICAIGLIPGNLSFVCRNYRKTCQSNQSGCQSRRGPRVACVNREHVHQRERAKVVKMHRNNPQKVVTAATAMCQQPNFSCRRLRCHHLHPHRSVLRQRLRLRLRNRYMCFYYWWIRVDKTTDRMWGHVPMPLIQTDICGDGVESRQIRIFQLNVCACSCSGIEDASALYTHMRTGVRESMLVKIRIYLFIFPAFDNKIYWNWFAGQCRCGKAPLESNLHVALEICVDFH